LTAIELPGFIIHQVKAKRDYWKEEQKKWQIPILKAKNWNYMPFDEIDKQLDKLSYIDELEIKNYLAEIRKWKDELQNSYEIIKERIDTITNSLLENYGEKFSIEANKFLFKTYLFKSKSNNLTIENLQKGLNTPNKIINIKRELGL
jgi:serine/threonine protein phosphatase 1